MKNIFIGFVIVLAGFMAKADRVIEVSAVSLLKAQSTDVQTMVPTCLPNRPCIGPKTTLMANYVLNGCLDQAVVTSKVEKLKNGKVRVLLSAVNLHDKRSLTALCVALPRKFVQVDLGKAVDKKDVEVVQLNKLQD